MHSDDEIRLRHMLDAAREAVGFFEGLERTNLSENRMLLLASVKALEIIGEAAAKISSGTQALCPDIPWADIVGMRHRLVHAYFDIDAEVVWQTIARDIPPLIALLDDFLGKGAQTGKTSP
jgi:uncharacterized protein with HEPN domain